MGDLIRIQSDAGDPGANLPTILAGAMTPDVRRRVEQFFISIPEIFEA